MKTLSLDQIREIDKNTIWHPYVKRMGPVLYRSLSNAAEGDRKRMMRTTGLRWHHSKKKILFDRLMIGQEDVDVLEKLIGTHQHTAAILLDISKRCTSTGDRLRSFCLALREKNFETCKDR